MPVKTAPPELAIADLTDDTVIVEFGNNKNCRIPMKKEAIAEVEKAEEN